MTNGYNADNQYSSSVTRGAANGRPNRDEVENFCCPGPYDKTQTKPGLPDKDKARVLSSHTLVALNVNEMNEGENTNNFDDTAIEVCEDTTQFDFENHHDFYESPVSFSDVRFTDSSSVPSENKNNNVGSAVDIFQVENFFPEFSFMRNPRINYFDSSKARIDRRFSLLHMQSLKKIHRNVFTKGFFKPLKKLNVRGVLFEWVFDVVYNFELSLEVAFSVCHQIQLIMNTRTGQFAKCDLQILATALIFVYSKFVDVNNISGQSCVSATCDSMTLDELFSLELLLMEVMDWQLCHSTLYHFLELHFYSCEIMCHTKQHYVCAMTMAELLYMDYQMMKAFEVEVLSAAIICLISEIPTVTFEFFVEDEEVDRAELLKCIDMLADFFWEAGEFERSLPSSFARYAKYRMELKGGYFRKNRGLLEKASKN